MKKILVFVLCFALAVLCAACSSANINTSDTEIDTMETHSDNLSATETETEPCQHVFKEEIYKEPNYGVDGVMIKYCTVCHEIEYLAVPALPDIFEITVKNKTVSTQGNECYVLFDIEIKNISDKKIEFISGNLSVMPPDCILELMCEFDNLSLEPYSTTRISSFGYSFDSTLSPDTVERKVCDAEFENIKFHFFPSDVVVAE